MTWCIFDNNSVCMNNKSPETFNKRCIEANNLLSNEQTICRFHVDVNKLYDPMSNEKETTQQDAVVHPSHYCQGGIECIKAIEASMTPEEFQGYCKGNVIKYCWRFREKNGLEDLKKAQVYLGWMIKSKEKQEQQNQ